MTVDEHLEFIAGIKGVSRDNMAREVNYIINKVGL